MNIDTDTHAVSVYAAHGRLIAAVRAFDAVYEAADAAGADLRDVAAENERDEIVAAAIEYGRLYW